MLYLFKIFQSVILFWSYQVIIAWIFSALSIYNSKTVFCFSLFFLTVFIAYLFTKRKKIINFYSSLLTKIETIAKKKKLLLLFFTVFWVFFFLFNLIYIFFLPAINWDSLTYHLTKIANAAQTGSLWYDSSVSVARVNIFGSNSSILNGVAFSLFGVDYLIELPQLIASILIPAALFYIGVVIFKQRKIYSFIASISVLTIPLFLYEANTTQNDLTFTLILLISIIFLFSLFKTFTWNIFFWTLFSIALLIGTKHHGIIAGGFIGLIVLRIFISSLGKIKFKHILLIFLSVPLLILIAFPNNIIGFLFYGSFIALDAGDAQKVVLGLETIFNNVRHFGKWFYTFSLENPSYYSHDVGHAGLLNMIAAPAFIFISFLGILYKKFNIMIFSFIVLGTLLTLFTIRNPDQWDLRLILFFPIIGVYIFSLLALKYLKHYLKNFFIILLTLLAIGNLVITFINVQYSTLRSSARTLILTGRPMSIGDYYFPRYMENIYELDKDRQCRQSRIILVGTNDSPLYPYYGERWENIVEYLQLIDITQSTLQNKSWDYLVIYHLSNKATKEKYIDIQNRYKKLTSDYYVDIFVNKINE